MKAQGFTLVELLAVIVILAVLALIATPVVLSIIDDAKESAMLRSAEMYLSGVENAVMRENMNSGGNFRPNECSISNGNMTCGTTNVEVEVDGEAPKSGEIIFENGKIKEVTLVYQSGTIVKDSSGKLIYEGSESNSYVSLGNYEHQLSNGTIESHDTQSGKCSKCGETVFLPGLYLNDGTFTSYNTLVSEGKVTQTTIPNYAFVDRHDIEKFVMPNSVTTIESYSFLGASIKSVILSSNLKKIDGFYASELQSITILEGAEEIAFYAFTECYSLKTMYIPQSMKKIGSNIFDRTALTDVYYAGTKSEWDSIEKIDGWNYGCPEFVVHCTDGDITIANG